MRLLPTAAATQAAVRAPLKPCQPTPAARPGKCVLRRADPQPVGLRSVVAKGSGGFGDLPGASDLKKSAKSVGNRANDLKEAFTDSFPRSRDDFKKEIKLRRLVQTNFAMQMVLSLVAWGVMFVTLHHNIGKSAQVITFPAVANTIGLLMAAISAFTSFTYIDKVKDAGEDVKDDALQAYEMQARFFDHIKINFVGIIAAIIGLQAEIGAMFGSNIMGIVLPATASATGVALSQAAANIILAHVVSMIFLSFMMHKISMAYRKLIAWSNEIQETMSKFSPS